MVPRPVLVVEDEPDLLENMQTLLEDEGYAVYCASNGQEALDILADASVALPGLVALDVTMPVMDGGAFLRSFPTTQAARDPCAPKVVLITAAEILPQEADEVQGLAIMKKPINIEQLLSSVERHCGAPC